MHGPPSLQIGEGAPMFEVIYDCFRDNPVYSRCYQNPGSTLQHQPEDCDYYLVGGFRHLLFSIVYGIALPID